MSVRIYTPSDIEVQALKSLVAEVKDNLPPTEINVLARVPLLAQELPRSLRTQIRDFAENETSDGIVVRTQDAFPNDYLRTPQDYDELNPAYRYNDVQIAHALVASLIGTPVGFRSQRGGRCLNNIIPTKALEALPNSSSGSRFDFGLHTEDAYHPFKADFLALACIRNDENAATSFASIKSVNLPISLMTELLKPQFLIGHNPIHMLAGALKVVPQSILYGRQDSPCMRINVANTRGIDRDAQCVLDQFIALLVSARESITLIRGDFFYLDNFYTAHARDAYQPNYGEHARWLSRFILAKDLRKSISARSSLDSRIIENEYEH
jgi:L-asparagine oxygenase